uniref:Chromosome 12 open reading frame 56 n=1 Tax=Equus asinus TaxID=9793 RepID=A0A9L0IL23_EQUAS
MKTAASGQLVRNGSGGGRAGALGRAPSQPQPGGRAGGRPGPGVSPRPLSPGAGAGLGAGPPAAAGLCGARVPGGMARPAPAGFPARTNSRLDAFLRRHLPPAVYDAVRAYEPCVVVSDSEKHTLKYVVLSDRLIYLTENPPKSIRRVVALRDVVAIDLIDDDPEFFSSPDRETNQHIRIIYSSSVLKKECEKSKGVRKFLFPFHHANSNDKKVKEEKNGPVFWRGRAPASLNEAPHRSEEKIKHFSQLKSELFLKDNTLRKMLCLITQLKLAAQKNFILKRLFWKTSDLFYFLVSKLREYLPESRDKNALQNKSRRADELVACIEIVQTLGLMFRETETESSRLNTLAAKEGTLFNLLVILISEPQIPKSCPVFDIQLVADSTLAEMSFDAELQKLILEYTDTATALLYEILLVFQQGNLGLGSTQFAVSWLMSFLQSRPPIMTFVASVVKQVVKGLSASLQLLSPGQAVLLYQQLCILRSCLQYSKTLAEYIRNDYREEFRYFIHMPALEKKLPLRYPIAQPTTQVFHEVLKLVEQKPCVRCE